MLRNTIASREVQMSSYWPYKLIQSIWAKLCNVFFKVRIFSMIAFELIWCVNMLTFASWKHKPIRKWPKLFSRAILNWFANVFCLATNKLSVIQGDHKIRNWNGSSSRGFYMQKKTLQIDCYQLFQLCIQFRDKKTATTVFIIRAKTSINKNSKFSIRALSFNKFIITLVSKKFNTNAATPPP